MDVTTNCPTCGSVVSVLTADEGTSSYAPIELRCTACGKPKPNDAAWARPVMGCECGNTMFGATVTFSG